MFWFLFFSCLCFTYYPWTWTLHRPIKGKKKPSATTLARALGMGFVRRFSTSMREEKVRTFKAEGPESDSRACRAIGWRMDFSTIREVAPMALLPISDEEVESA